MPATPAATVNPPGFFNMSAIRKFSVSDYNRMIASGVLTDEDPVELLEGYLVLKMPRDPAHDHAVDELAEYLFRTVPVGWFVKGQTAVRLPESQPEPDVAVVRGQRAAFRGRHAGPADIAFIAEVANTSLNRDRDDKGRIYARERIPVYWVVNVVDRLVEVYTDPTGPTAQPRYQQRYDYPEPTTVPVVLDGITIGAVTVADLMS